MHRAALLVVALGAVGGGGRAAAQTPPRPDSAVGSLEGTVRGRFDGRARLLGHAVVEAVGAGFGFAAVADSLGHYVIPGLPEGRVRVRASHPGHESLTLSVWLPARETVRVDLELRGAPIALPPLEVQGEAVGAEGAVASPEGPSRSLPELELQALDMTPGVGEPGLLEAVRALPGNDPADATDVLFMRGSTTDLKLVLLDGVPVYTPFHVAGLMKSFEPSVIGGADLHVGGAPARYDGGLTHILDLTTRRARRDAVRASGSVDFLSAAAATEAPLGARAGVMLSARSLHDLGRAALGGARPYGYQDVLLSVDADPAAGHEVRATAFWNAESVRLDFEPIPGDAEWSNRAASLRYGARVGGAHLDLTGGVSGYRASLPLQPAGRPGEPTPGALLATAEMDRVRLVAEARFGPADAPVRAGVSLDGIDASYRAVGSSGSAASHASSSSPGAYVDVTRPLGPGLTLRAGLRGDLFDMGVARLAPRAALHWEVGPEALLTLAAGRYHQVTRARDFEVERTLAEVAGDGVSPSELLPVATADHVVLSLQQRLGGRVDLDLEGFWKRYEGLETTGGKTIRSSGVDVRVVSKGEARVVWLGYGLSWFWSGIDLSGRASDFIGRHLLSTGASGRLAGPLHAEARLAYGAGLPYTSLPFHDAVVGDQLSGGTLQSGPRPQSDAFTGEPVPPIVGGLDEEFLRLDVELHVLLEPTWGGRPWEVRPYVRILNALDRRDALFYTFQPWRPDSVRALAERPLLPLLGVAFSF